MSSACRSILHAPDRWQSCFAWSPQITLCMLVAGLPAAGADRASCCSGVNNVKRTGLCLHLGQRSQRQQAQTFTCGTALAVASSNLVAADQLSGAGAPSLQLLSKASSPWLSCNWQQSLCTERSYRPLVTANFGLAEMHTISPQGISDKISGCLLEHHVPCSVLA